MDALALTQFITWSRSAEQIEIYSRCFYNKDFVATLLDRLYERALNFNMNLDNQQGEL